MKFFNKRYSSDDEQIVLEPKDWTEEEWATILKLFGFASAERIIVRDFALEAYECEKEEWHTISDEEWQKAKSYLEMLIVEYASIGPAGRFGLDGVLVPLRKRFEKGERTKELYDEIMRCE